MKNFLVYTTLTAWKEPPRSRHQVTTCLQGRGVVYFVERSRIGLPRIEIELAEENVVVLTPFFPIDFRVRYRTPGLNELYHYWLINKIKDLNVDFEIVFTFDHTSHIIHRFYENVVYYCGDDFIGNGDYSIFFINLFHKLIEKKLTANSQMCVVTSNHLLKKQIQFNKHTHLIPLGSPKINHLPTYKQPASRIPTLGLVGYLNRKIPLEILDQMLAEFKIYLIGPAELHITHRYRHNENAVFTGPKGGPELYQLLNDEVDVCIAPYKEEKVNKGGTPNKLWLYLALGKPCVVTEIPEIRSWDFGAKVFYKCGNEDFIKTCKTAYFENNKTLFFRRIQIAEENSWEKRVDGILDQYYKIQRKKKLRCYSIVSRKKTAESPQIRLSKLDLKVSLDFLVNQYKNLKR